jgi:hypothetical protein
LSGHDLSIPIIFSSLQIFDVRHLHFLSASSLLERSTIGH